MRLLGGWGSKGSSPQAPVIFSYACLKYFLMSHESLYQVLKLDPEAIEGKFQYRKSDFFYFVKCNM